MRAQLGGLLLLGRSAAEAARGHHPPTPPPSPSPACQQSYTLYKFTKAAAVPASPTAPLNRAGAAWSRTFTATAASQTLAVTFNSGEPAWFVAEAAPRLG